MTRATFPSDHGQRGALTGAQPGRYRENMITNLLQKGWYFTLQT